MGRKPKYASSDPKDGPWTMCDVCGFQWSQGDMQFQYAFQGASVLQPTGVLKCPKCLDPPNYQDKMQIIPPDPPVFYNLRPEPFQVDETNWLNTLDGDRITTVSGEAMTTDIPNSQDAGMQSQILFVARQPGANLATNAWLDLFDGNPVGSNYYSVLSQLTGSAVRQNLASRLTITATRAVNTLDISIVASILNTANITHLALFTTVSGPVMTVSGPVSVSPTAQKGFALEFPSGGISIQLT